MYAPSKFADPDIVFSGGTGTDHCSGQPVDHYYNFGSANTNSEFQPENFEGRTEMLCAMRSTISNGFTTHAMLDRQLWTVVSNWKNHYSNPLNRCRCVIAAIINHADGAALRITNVTLRDGREYEIIGACDYDADSSTILPGGCAVLFAYGNAPNIFNPGHVGISLETNMFTSNITTRTGRLKCTSVLPFTANMLERSQGSTELWAKVVITATG